MSLPTEIRFKIKLRIDTPKEVIQLINKCLDREYPKEIPSNHFFKTEKWFNLFSTMGYDGYEQPYLKEIKNGYELKIHTDINYEKDELDTFIEWIKPYVFGRRKKVFLGDKLPDYDCERTNVYLYR